MKKKVLTIDDANKKLIGQYRDLDKYKHRTEPKRLLKELKNIHSGEDIWVVAAGSTMNYINPSFFENKITLGINQTYEKYPCDYIVGKDINLASRWDDTIDELIDHPTIKFLYSKWFQGYPDKGENRVPNCDNFYMWDNTVVHNQITIIDGIRLDTDFIISIRSTLHSAMHIAAYMGAKNIILCGNDIGTITKPGEVKASLYYDGYVKEHWTDSGNWGNGQIEHWLALNGQITMDLKKKLTEVYGCNIHSLNPFINLQLEDHKYKPTR